MRIVLLYAGILTLLFVALSVRTVRLRGRLRIAIGHGQDEALQRAVRVHANFAEYVPLALLLIAFVEATGRPAWVVHALGLLLVIGRIVHAIGVSRVDERFAFRVAGMTLTFAVLTVAALDCLFTYFATFLARAAP